MNNNEKNRLQFENILWIIFAGLCFLNIVGDNKEINYLYNKQKEEEETANKIFSFTLIITFLIYLYFFTRNYKAYEQASETNKKLYSIKLLGSSFLIAGIICFIYFQEKQTSFIGSPAI